MSKHNKIPKDDYIQLQKDIEDIVSNGFRTLFSENPIKYNQEIKHITNRIKTKRFGLFFLENPLNYSYSKP